MTIQWPLQLHGGSCDEVITIVVKNDTIHFLANQKTHNVL
jgi:hypothetical protein